MGKKKKNNPYCPVAGCKTSKSHIDDPIVKGLIRAFAPPDKMTLCARVAMAELSESICTDFVENKLFAYVTRLRQPEELYIRTLYALFIATEAELPHILSGASPNGFSHLYSAVNRVVFEGRGLLQVKQQGLRSGTFTPMEMLNDGAHLSFRSLLTCIGWARNPENVPSLEDYRKHLSTYCTYLNHMHAMFRAGKEKKDVLAAVVNLHRPANHWKAR